MSKVLVIGPLPPPLNGAAKNTKIFTDLISKESQVLKLPTQSLNGSAHARNWKYHLDRAALTLRNAKKIITYITAKDSAYIVADGGKGIFYNILYAIALRSKGVKKIWIHHRNLQNISNKATGLKLFTKILGTKATHIFLTQEMAGLFSQNISYDTKHEILSNSATCDIDPAPVTHNNSKYCTVGFLSNLTSEKGFDIVCDSFEKIEKEIPEIIFSIAGPAINEDAKKRLKQLEINIGPKLKYWGAVNAEKNDFYHECDIFIFPTKYKLEAQPNVIFEALAAGCYVISTKHACIPETLDGAEHSLIQLGPNTEMVESISNEIKDAFVRLDEAETRSSIRRANIEFMKNDQIKNKNTLKRIISEISG